VRFTNEMSEGAAKFDDIEGNTANLDVEEFDQRFKEGYTKASALVIMA